MAGGNLFKSFYDGWSATGLWNPTFVVKHFLRMEFQALCQLTLVSISSQVSEVSLCLHRFYVIPKIVDERYHKYFRIFTKIFDQIFQHPLMILVGRFGICFQSLYVIAKIANRFGWIDLQQLEDKLVQFLSRYLNPQQQHHQQQQQPPNVFSSMRCYG